MINNIERINQAETKENAVSKVQDLYKQIHKRVSRGGGKMYENLVNEYLELKNIKDKFNITNSEIDQEYPRDAERTFEIFESIIKSKHS